MAEGMLQKANRVIAQLETEEKPSPELIKEAIDSLKTLKTYIEYSKKNNR